MDRPLGLILEVDDHAISVNHRILMYEGHSYYKIQTRLRGPVVAAQ
jgi:hypothetical protein